MTGMDIFEISMALMDSINENSGEADTADNREYKVRAPYILQGIINELYPYSDTYNTEQTGRPLPLPFSTLDDPVDLDDYLCKSVAPYGLAAALLSGEDAAMTNFFRQIYESLKAGAARGVPKSSGDIQDIYGGIEYGYFSRW